MDECRFDNWTRLIAGLRDRRAALKEMTGAGLALVSLARADLGFAAEDDVLVEGCRLAGDSCSKNSQCCSDYCKGNKKKKKKKNGGGKKQNRENGECRCVGTGKYCTKDAACCHGYCDRDDNECRCTPQGATCNNDDDCCKGECRADRDGHYFCSKRKKNGKR